MGYGCPFSFCIFLPHIYTNNITFFTNSASRCTYLNISYVCSLFSAVFPDWIIVVKRETTPNHDITVIDGNNCISFCVFSQVWFKCVIDVDGDLVYEGL